MSKDPDELKEKLRFGREHGGLQISPAATPNRRNTVAPRAADPAWERGIITDPRPNGTRMPVLDGKTLEPIGVHEAQSRRHEINEHLRRSKQS